MEHIEVDMRTGVQKTVPNTSDEISVAVINTAAENISRRKRYILRRLQEIDVKSIRALRAHGTGRHNQRDTDDLNSYELEAVDLRIELANLNRGA